MRKVFCACGFNQEVATKDIAFDLAVAHRGTHNRPFLDTKISAEYESPKQLNASNKVKVKKEDKMVTFENDVPMPETSRRVGKVEKYGFAKMEVKQSFFIPSTPEKDAIETAKTIRNAAYSAEKRIQDKESRKVRFSVLPVETTVDDQVVTGARCWRTE